MSNQDRTHVDEETPSITFEHMHGAAGAALSYADRIRSWGENTERKPEDSVAQSLAPPARIISTVGSFESRVQAPLVVIPETGFSGGGSSVVSAPVSSAGNGGRGPPPTSSTRPNGSIRREASVAVGKRGGASTIQGKKTVRLSVLPVSGHNAASIRSSAQNGGVVLYDEATSNRILSFAPKRLLDIENGTSIVVSDQRFLNQNRFQEVGKDGALVVSARTTAPNARQDAHFFQDRAQSLQDKINAGDIRDLNANNEVDILGGAWRGIVRRFMMWSSDEINALRLSRQMQLFLPFLTAYESYVIGQIVEAMDSGRASDIKYVLQVAFRNRNVSRILVQLLGPRWDFLWHSHQAVTWNRWFDSFGQLPIIGITSFPASENFPATRDHALASIFRVVLGEGRWVTRVLTRGRQGLVTDNPEKNVAQNLAAESNGFEGANRNQFGTYVGRRKTNEFRLAHHLPVDESTVRTFMAQPMPTILNNGVVHVLRQLAKHWHNMLFQSSGNFAHQRMEQLNPFEIMRFHMPMVCVVLSTLRGRNAWDANVLGPFLRKCQELKPSMTADACRYIVCDMQDNIVVNLCAGVASVVDPLRSWLDAIHQACDAIEAEAKEVYQNVTSVEIGIRLGHDLITQVSWKIPSDKELKKAILNHIRGLNPGPHVSERRIRSAMLLTTPRDKRTLIELVKNNLTSSKPAQLLLGRVKTLLQRDLRRENLNEAIRELSMGDYVTEVMHDEWYWLEEGEKRAAYIYDAKVTGRDLHRFIHVESGFERFVSLSDGTIKARAYVPVAEAISRAQRCFMNIELEHGKKFTYNAFMEFSFLRTALRRLVVISQITCEELDNARLNVLREVQRSNQVQVAIHDLEPGRTYYVYDSKQKTYEPFLCKKVYTAADPEWATLARTKIVKIPPQSIIVVGGGPTGLITTIHCTENVLVTGGVMKLYEARDAFTKGGAAFERAQIVRLDARWIAMLRYYLGTGFEDVYIPASGETDAQLGNTLPSQGFVEITIKDLENMLHVEISKLWSKGVIQCYTGARAQYDPVTNSLSKMGEHLNMDDLILRRVDPNGNSSAKHFSWKVADLVYTQALGLDDLRVGEEYGVYVRLENAVLPFKLTGVDLESRTYTFKSLKDGIEDLKASAHNLPSVYPKGTTRHADVSKIVVECVQKGKSGGYVRDELPMKVIRKEKFTMDVGNTHVVECVGKPHGSKVHFCVTTLEPHGVCCIQGLKISMGMHNFGEKRWGQGLLDDFRSQNDRNTRIIGDFTKMVRQAPVAKLMADLIKTDNWQAHFKAIIAESKFPELNEMDPVVPKIIAACEWLGDNAVTFRRKTLQTRFFETGDNYYLGMEFTREYDKWKINTGEEIVAPLFLRAMDDGKKMEVQRLKGVILHHIDRLWYESCLETIRQGDVYNPGARHRVPRLYLTNSYFDAKLGTLPVGESFRLSERPEEKYEIVIKGGSQVIVRNVEGYISKMSKSTLVKREGNLTRTPDGNQESRVSLATFPVAHYVNHRTVRLNDESKGYVFTFIGDEQATPHFMRYSGLTGACINAMLFNNFVKQAIDGVSFQDRYREYSEETNWSNGEVVQRGCGANYGQDSFLRPGFSYRDGIDYMHSKAIEWMETGQDLNNLLSRDWTVKFAASMVPRGMELSEDFVRALYMKTQTEIFDKFITEVKLDKSITRKKLVEELLKRKESLDPKREVLGHESYWNEFMAGMDRLDDDTKMRLEDFHCEIAKRLEQAVNHIIEFATKAYLNNQRVSSEMFNQPKPVDSIVDDFAVEAQSFANSLTMSAALSSAALAFTLVDIRGQGSNVGSIWAAIIAGLNILNSFGTMTNVSRYKVRNEEARIYFFDDKFLNVKKAVFSVMDRKTQDAIPDDMNPFVMDLESKVEAFLKSAEYYDLEEPIELKQAYAALRTNINDPEAIRAFQKELAGYFIADLHHVNSYVQDFLVNIYKVLDDMHYQLTQQIDKATGGESAKHLFYRLNAFTTPLDNSLQRGPTYWGFLKQRRLWHWDCTVVFRYFYSLLCCARAGGPTPLAPIQTQTLGLLKQTRALSKQHQNQILRREIRDIEQLYWATRESDIASLIFCSGFLVFVASIIFTISRIVTRAGGPSTVTDVAFWATTASATGAILGAFHLIRKFFILIGLWGTLGRKIREAKSMDDREAIQKVRGVTFTQVLLTVTRLGIAGAAAVALPWAVAQNGFDDQINLSKEIPFWIALGAVSAGVASTLFFFFVEYFVRYNLSPRLGEYVCEAFRDEIEAMKKVLSIPINDIETKQVQEREAWEYVAREFLHQYRFDTVFAADRFGSILQYIQSGMDPRR